MAGIKKYNFKGEQIEEIQIPDTCFEDLAHPQSVKEYIVAIRANKRQWSAKTKERADVSCTNKKPHAQKGTGRARQGSLAAPQYKGGGVVFGPRPKFDQHQKINKKEKRAVVKTLLLEKIKEGKVHLLQFEKMKEPKTKYMHDFLSKLNLQDRKTLFLVEPKAPMKKDRYHNFAKSMRNIPLKHFKHLESVNGYELANNGDIILLEDALEQFKTMIGA